MPWNDRIRNRLRLRDLDILMAVIDAGSMGKAAARFNMTQPAVSKVIADLEHTLGVRLVERSRRGVEPTPHGLALGKRGVAVFDELQQGVQDLDLLSDPTAGEIRIGCTEPIAAAIVSPVVDRLTRQYPRVAFHVLADGVPAVLEQELAQRKLELIITRVSDPIAADQSAEILFHDTLVVATGAKHPLTRRRKVTLSEIASEPWLLPLNPLFGSVIVAAFYARGLEPPRLTVSTTSINLRNNLLASGRFMTVTPSFLLKLPRRHPFLRALSVDLPNAQHPIAIIRLKNRVPSALSQLFCDRVRALTRPLAKD